MNDRIDTRVYAMLNSDNLIMETLSQWVLIEHEGKSVTALMREMGYQTIGIYGHGYLGQLLERTTDKREVTVKCVIDRKYDGSDGFHISLEQDLPKMDAIIVTSPYYFKEIRRDIEQRDYVGEIRSLDELLYQL